MEKHDELFSAKKNQQQQQHQQPASAIFNTIDENALMMMRGQNYGKKRSDNTKKVSKYNAHMNNFHHADYPTKGPISHPRNPLKDKNVVDHPVFVMAKQLLSLTIGNFRKHDAKFKAEQNGVNNNNSIPSNPQQT